MNASAKLRDELDLTALIVMQISRHSFPLILDQVQHIAGLDPTMRLAFALGGRRVYCPQTSTPELIAQIGVEAADAIGVLYHNEMISVPLGPFGSGPTANRVAREALLRGFSLSKAARVAGVTERTIQFIKRDLRERQSLTVASTPNLSAVPSWLVEAVSADARRTIDLNLSGLARIYGG